MIMVILHAFLFALTLSIKAPVVAIASTNLNYSLFLLVQPVAVSSSKGLCVSNFCVNTSQIGETNAAVLLQVKRNKHA